MATKNQSKQNIIKGKTGEYISISFFAKFIKAKVDKKRTIEEIKHLADQIDLDRDGCISVHDLEAYLTRLNFKDFF